MVLASGVHHDAACSVYGGADDRSLFAGGTGRHGRKDHHGSHVGTVGYGDDVVDICACCAPHVAHTGEIGLIKVVSVAAYKGGTQIGILCGKRALDYIRNEHEMIDKLARSFSTSILYHRLEQSSSIYWYINSISRPDKRPDGYENKAWNRAQKGAAGHNNN